MLEQHHFPNQSNTLFKAYNQTFFDIKRKAKAEGNKGLEALAKLCINAPTGKWGENPANQARTKLVEDSEEFLKLFLSKQENMDIAILNENVAMVNIQDNDQYTEFKKGNVYISTFITGYARLKLYEDALEPLQEDVLYFDTDSVVYVSSDGQPKIPIDTTGELGLWTSEAVEGDHFIGFTAAGPKTYALLSAQGNNIAKSKGFCLHHSNSELFHFDSLKEQVLHKACNKQIQHLKLHQGDALMKRDGKFNIEFEYNSITLL